VQEREPTTGIGGRDSSGHWSGDKGMKPPEADDSFIILLIKASDKTSF